MANERLQMQLSATRPNFAPQAFPNPGTSSAPEQTKVVMAHELAHAIIGLSDPPVVLPDGKNGGVVNLVENPSRTELGMPDRQFYDDTPVPSMSGVSDIDRAKFQDFLDENSFSDPIEDVLEMLNE